MLTICEVGPFENLFKSSLHYIDKTQFACSVEALNRGSHPIHTL